MTAAVALAASSSIGCWKDTTRRPDLGAVPGGTARGAPSPITLAL